MIFKNFFKDTKWEVSAPHPGTTSQRLPPFLYILAEIFYI